MYDNMMNKFKWGNADDPSVYLDENNRRMFSNFRRIFGTLGKELAHEEEILQKPLKLPTEDLKLSRQKRCHMIFSAIGLAEVLIRAGKKRKVKN